jgi:hypothetical protein
MTVNIADTSVGVVATELAVAVLGAVIITDIEVA